MAKQPYNSIPTYGLAIDWETSGYTVPNYAQHHQGISFGAIIFNVRTLEAIDSLYYEIKFNPKYRWEVGAEKVHKVSREYLEANGVSQEEAAVALGNMVVKYIGLEDVMLLGHRVYFDKAFTQQLTESIGIQFNYHPTVIDSSAMGTILLETSLSEEVFQTLGLPQREAHNAMEDITYTLESVKKMKEFFFTGVSNFLSEG